MKLSVLALDYDGTIARDDRLDPSVRDAVVEARRRGIVVMLVTGRRLDDLRRVAGDLHVVDGVVAENGALVHFPDGGLTTALDPPIPDAFAAEALGLIQARKKNGLFVVRGRKPVGFIHLHDLLKAGVA